MQIFTGFTSMSNGKAKRASYNSGVIENVFFLAFGRYDFGTLGNEANIITEYYLVPCRLSTDPKKTGPGMTLNGLKDHFTLYVHYYERPLTNYLLLKTCDFEWP